jgi:hypothetical protein
MEKGAVAMDQLFNGAASLAGRSASVQPSRKLNQVVPANDPTTAGLAGPQLAPYG